MEGKASTIAKLSEEAKEEDFILNKIGVNNFRHPVKKPSIFHFYKNYGQDRPLFPN